jgi:RNA polymerase sigma factor (sigma-70 family)
MREKITIEEALEALQMDPRSDQHWIALHDLLRPFILATAYRILGPTFAAQAQDIAQETFLQLWRAPVFDQFQNTAKLRGYLRTVAQNRAIDFLRTQGRTPPNISLGGDFYLDLKATADEYYAADELMRRLNRALNPSDRKLLDLVLLGYAAPEVAAHLEISDVAARVRLHRLRDRIRRLLSGDEPLPAEGR